jgi:hypothetical protein
MLLPALFLSCLAAAGEPTFAPADEPPPPPERPTAEPVGDPVLHPDEQPRDEEVEPAAPPESVQPTPPDSTQSGDKLEPVQPEAQPLPNMELPPSAQVSPMEVCAQPNEADMTMLQRVRRSLTVGACASSAWLDGLFGDQIHYDEYHATYGSVSTGGLWSDYDGFDPRLRFRVRLQLPQWNQRISAFAGRVGEDDYVSDTEGDFDALPTRQFGNLEDESVLVGLGYSSPKRTGNDFDVGVGVRVDVPPDPYVRTRYEVVRAFAERYVFSARETLFWQNSEGFGTTTRVNIDRVISDRFLVRWSNVGKFTEETIGMEWYTQLTLFQSVGAHTGLAWQAQVEGATDNEVPLTRTAVRLIMRRQLTPEWLVLELRGGVGWPRRKLVEERKMSPEVGIALEMMFGEKK